MEPPEPAATLTDVLKEESSMHVIDFSKNLPHSEHILVNGEDIGFDPFFTYEESEYQESTSQGRLTVDLRWDDLCYDVQVKSGGFLCFGKNQVTTKHILKNVSGEIHAGQMLAIMGSSGAGKTTMLNLLAGRLSTSKNYETRGRVLLNGKKRNYGVFKKISAYVEQDDNMFGELTVEEQIAFSAYLRLPGAMDRTEKKNRVDSIIQELGLAKVKNSYIGNAIIRGVSGGERKRVNVGTELVTDPSLIFCDEPTSGLDSFNALNVMYTLRRLASNQRTVITTIHQPRSNIFYLFDYLCLLSEGAVMYFGPAQDAVTYFAGLNFRCPEQFNPADYFIDLLSIDSRQPDEEKKTRARVEYLGEKQAEAKSKEKEDKEGDFASQATYNNNATPENVDRFHASWLNEISLVGGRAVKLMLRERVSNIARIFQSLFFALLLGLIWLNAGRFDYNNPTLAEVQAINGVLFFITINQAFGGVFAVIFVYPLERAVVLRERASGSYRVSSYMLAKTLAELPRNFVIAFLFGTIVYWMIGLRSDAGAFFLFIVIIILMGSTAEALTLCISTVSPDPQAASAITPVFIILFMLFGGFFIGTNSIPAWIAWLRWVSFINYGFQAAVSNNFKGTAAFDLTNQVLGIEMSLGAACGGLLGFWVFFRFLWYVILRVKGPKFDRNL